MTVGDGIAMMLKGFFYAFGAGAALELFLVLHGTQVNDILEIMGAYQ